MENEKELIEAKCEVCGETVFVDKILIMTKCPHCGWRQEGKGDGEAYEEMYGISYPMLVSLSHAREQYKSGKPFKANFEEFINGLLFYAEMLFWHDGICYEVFIRADGAVLASKDIMQTYATIDDFKAQANIHGRLLVDIWDEVVHPCFMYCGDPETDYDVPPED